MGEFGQNNALSLIEGLNPLGGTNMYKALELAVNLIHDRNDKTRDASVMFFTDGIPNYSPARGEIEAVKKLKRQKKFAHPIHTMGFGMYTRLDGYVLLEIAQNTHGMFSHIKDASNVGTVFVNGISNIMTTALNDLKM